MTVPQVCLDPGDAIELGEMLEFLGEGEPGTDALVGLSKVVFSTTLRGPLSWALPGQFDVSQ
jgi:hypothetical protein